MDASRIVDTLLSEGVIGQAKPVSFRDEQNHPYYKWEFRGEYFPRTNSAGAAKSKDGTFTVDFRTGEIRTYDAVAGTPPKADIGFSANNYAGTVSVGSSMGGGDGGGMGL